VVFWFSSSGWTGFFLSSSLLLSYGCIFSILDVVDFSSFRFFRVLVVFVILIVCFLVPCESSCVMITL
jgi:hypothetical protein